MSRNSVHLPKTFGSESIRDVFDGLDSEDVDILIRSYAALPSSRKFVSRASFDGSHVRTQSHMSELQERLVSAPEQALAIICKSAMMQYLRDVDAVAGACQLLAELTER